MAEDQAQSSFESFDQLVTKIRKSGNPVRNQGTLFEYMVQVYLKKAYPEQFSHVWMLKELPDWTHIPHKDLGVDLVAQDANTHQFIAVQAKFYEPDHKVSKPDTNTFVAELGKKYYSAGIWVASNDVFNQNAEACLTGTSKKITRIGLSDLRNANIDWSKFDAENLSSNLDKDLTKSHKKMRFYQKEAVHNALKYYDKPQNTRGKLIMAPGTGKTYTSLQIAQALQNH